MYIMIMTPGLGTYMYMYNSGFNILDLMDGGML